MQQFLPSPKQLPTRRFQCSKKREGVFITLPLLTFIFLFLFYFLKNRIKNKLISAYSGLFDRLIKKLLLFCTHPDRDLDVFFLDISPVIVHILAHLPFLPKIYSNAYLKIFSFVLTARIVNASYEFTEFSGSFKQFPSAVRADTTIVGLFISRIRFFSRHLYPLFLQYL